MKKQVAKYSATEATDIEECSLAVSTLKIKTINRHRKIVGNSF